MCGIVGYIGKKKGIPILIDGLKKLEYRGYDSAGVAYFKNNKINVVKSVGRIKYLESKLVIDENCYVGIGHTRWATHGEVNELNSHPHKYGEVFIVHNGIIENYLEIKELLINNGYTFYGETDTEIAAGFINYEYERSTDKNIIQILNKCMDKFIGSYAIVVMFKSINDKLFVMKKDSPLVIFRGNEENFIASDVSAYMDKTCDYVILDDRDIGIISNDNILIYRDGIEQNIDFNKIDCSVGNIDLDNFQHYMLKEINEQSLLIEKWNKYYLNNLDKLIDLESYKRIQIIGCGTAYHAGLVGKYLIEKYSDIEVNVFIASEYRYQKLFVDGNTLVIAVSQSGETADTLACVKRVKEFGVKTLGIINVRNSSIARLVDEVIYTEAGPEVAVASTKAYMSQVYIFSMLALKLRIKNKLLNENILADYRLLPDIINKIINLDYKRISAVLSKQNDIFYLGRGIDYVTMLEGALKLKEISYINCNAFPAGELKHGTISLIEDNTPVIGLITDLDIASKTISNIVEVKSRGAYVILLVSNGASTILDKNICDELILINDIDEILRPMLAVVYLQLIAYYTALEKGCDIDKPRNLAKSVTVE